MLRSKMNFWFIFLPIVLIGSLKSVHASTVISQTGWLLKTESATTANLIPTSLAPMGSFLYLFDFSAQSYTGTFRGRAGWTPGSFTIDEGKQFILETPNGTDEYLQTSYQYLGEWNLVAPSTDAVSGNVLIEWEALNISSNSPPDFSAKVTISGADNYEADLGVIWSEQSVIWPSQAAPNGDHTITVSIMDSPQEGYAGHVVATIAKDVVLDNSSSTILMASTSSVNVASLVSTSPANEIFEVWGTGPINYTITDDVNWLSCSPTNGSSSGEHDSVSISFESDFLAAGSYTSLVTISSAEAANATRVLEVVLVVDSGEIQATQTGWLLRAVEMTPISAIPWTVAPAGSVLYLFDLDSGYYQSAMASRSGFSGSSIIIEPEQQFILETPSVGDGYTQSSFAYVGDWRLTEPIGTAVSGDVVVEWEPRKVSSFASNPPPNYATRVSVDGVDISGLIRDGSSVTWYSQAASNGAHTISLSIMDSPAPGLALHEVASITKEVMLDNAGLFSLVTSVTKLTALTTFGSSPTNQVFELWGSESLSYEISENVAWLSCTPTNGASDGEHDLIMVEFDAIGLGTGSYTGVIDIVSGEATNSPRQLEVVMDVVPVVLSLSGNQMVVTTIEGAPPASRIFEVWGNALVNYVISDDAKWLSCSPDSGSSGGEHDTITVEVDSTALTVGSYTGVIQLVSDEVSNSPQEIQVVLNVDPLLLEVSEGQLIANSLLGESPADQSFEVWGSDLLNYSISNNVSWLTCSPASGSSDGEHDLIVVEFNVESLAIGSYTGLITVASDEAANAFRDVNVILEIAGVAATQSSWLFRTANTISPKSIPWEIASVGSLLHLFDFEKGYYQSAMKSRSGFYPGDLQIPEGKQFVIDPHILGEVNPPSPYAYIGGWQLVEPIKADVSGEVMIEWNARYASGIAGYPPPDYCTQVYIDGEDLSGVVWSNTSVVWNSAGARNGDHTIKVSIMDSPFPGAPGVTVAEIIKGVVLNNWENPALLRAASNVTVSAISEDQVPYGSQVALFNGGGYITSTYEEGLLGDADGWNPTNLLIGAGEQFVFNPAGNGLDYHKWPYAYIGDWRSAAPDNPIVWGDVLVAWEAYDQYGSSENPKPDYAARVSITGLDISYLEDLGLIRDTNSISWESYGAPSGTYEVMVSIVDSPFAGIEGPVIASFTNEVYLFVNPVENQRNETVAGVTLDLNPTNLVVGYSTAANTLSVSNGGVISSIEGYVGLAAGASRNTVLVDGANSSWINTEGLYVGGSASAAGGMGNIVTITNGGLIEAESALIYPGNTLRLREGGTLIVQGDFDASQSGFDHDGGSLEVRGSLIGLSDVPAGNRLEVTEFNGDLTVNGVFSSGTPASADTKPQALAIRAATLVESGALVNGSLTLSARGTIEMELGGYGMGDGYDHLAVTGIAVLEGVLDVVFVKGFTPALGSVFDLFDWDGGVSGDFSSIRLPELPFGLAWNSDAIYSSGSLSVELNSDDTDADGMVDGWEYDVLGEDVSPSRNPDVDPFDNLSEYIAGTDPASSSSYFWIESAQRGSNGLVIAWAPSLTGRFYSVMWTNDLSGAYEPVATNLAYPENSYTDTVHEVESSGFYKVEVRLK